MFQDIPHGPFSVEGAEATLAKLHGGPVAGLDSAPMGLKAAACLIAKGQLNELAAKAEAASAAAASEAGAGASSSSSSAAGPQQLQPGAPGTYMVAMEALGDFMRLDLAAVKALSLLPPRSRRDERAEGGGGALGGVVAEGAAGAVTSVYGLLTKYARTAAGRRRLKAWLLQPLTDVVEIEARQLMVTAFYESAALRDGWRTRVSVGDTAPLLNRLAPKPSSSGSGKAAPKPASLMDVVKLKQLLEVLPAAIALLDPEAYDGPEECTAPLAAKRAGLTELDDWLEDFRAEYTDTVDDSNLRRGPRVKASKDPELEELAESIDEGRAAMEKLTTRYRSDWPDEVSSSLSLVFDRAKGGWVFKTKKAADKALRSVPGASTVAVLKDGIYFTTPKLSGLAETLSEREEAYGERSKALVGPLMELAKHVVPVVESVAVILGDMDAFYSMAMAAHSCAGTWVRPTLVSTSPPEEDGGEGEDDSAEGDIRVLGGRHPVVELQEGVSSFIPNDYCLRRQQGRFQIITGE